MSDHGQANGANGAGGNGAGSITVHQACTVLFSEMPALDSSDTQALLEEWVGPCVVDWADAPGVETPLVGGVAQFGPHRVIMLAMRAPVSPDMLTRTVAVSPMPDERRQELMAHRASIRLLYVGQAEEPLEQLTALYRVAGTLVEMGGLGIINERAALAQPAELAAFYLPRLGSDPQPVELWIGVVTFLLDEGAAIERYLMRTYGMEQFGLQELGLITGDRASADDNYHLMMNVGLYLIESDPRAQIGVGHTVDFNGRTYLLTEPDIETAEEEDLMAGLLMLIGV